MNIEDIIGIDALQDSLRKCANGVRWKGSVAHYVHNWIDELSRLSEDLRSGTYKPHKGKRFIVTEPKYREILSVHFRDRIYQRSLNDVAIYPQTSRSFIRDNYACQKGKGTYMARERLKEFLQKFYRHHGTEGYVLQIDIKGYYPNMSHEYVEQMLRNYLDDETYKLALSILRSLPNKVGYNPGSQMVQIIGITALDGLDHYVKEVARAKYYLRYMDDMVIIHEDKAFLEDLLKKITEILASQEMTINESKTAIRPIREPILHLGFIYRLTETGKVVILADPAKVKHERKKLRRMVTKVRRGELTKRDVDEHFKAYKACVRYGNSHNLINRLNRYYENLWKGNEDAEKFDHK